MGSSVHLRLDENRPPRDRAVCVVKRIGAKSFVRKGYGKKIRFTINGMANESMTPEAEP
jgi:hypothetical protein